MNKKQLLLASFGHFLCDLNTGALPALLPFFVSVHSLSYSAVSALVLANTSLASLVQPFFGLMADRYCKAWFMPLGILIAGIGMGSIGLLDSFIPLFCAVGLSGLGTALFHPSAMRYAAMASGSKQGTGTSVFSVGGNAGFLLAPLIVVFLVERYGLRSVALFAPLALCMALLIFLESFAVQRSLQKKAQSIKQEVTELPQNNWNGFLRLLGAILCRSVLMTCIRVFVPLYWIAFFASSTAEAALILTLFGLSGILGNLTGGMLADRFGYNRIIRLSYFFLIPLVFFLPNIDSLWLANAVVIVLGFVLYASFSPTVVVGQRYLAKNLGFASGITLGVGISFGGMLAPVLGWVADCWGLGNVFYCLGAFAVAGFICTFFLLPVPERCSV